MIKTILVLLTGALVLAACYERHPTDAAEQALQFRVEADSLPADGATLLLVAATIPRQARTDRRAVTFASTAGTFRDGGEAKATITAIDGTADTYLRAPRQPGRVRIRAEYGSVVRDTTVEFHVAQPDRAELQVSAFQVKASLESQITATAHLRRTVGQPTSGIQIRFETAREDNGQPLGRFNAVLPSDVNGTVTVTYSPGDTSYRGAVRISAVASEGRVLGETSIDVIAPG